MKRASVPTRPLIRMTSAAILAGCHLLAGCENMIDEQAHAPASTTDRQPRVTSRAHLLTGEDSAPDGIVLLSAASTEPTPALELIPDLGEYAVDVPLLQDSVALTVFAANPEAAITVAGTALASGATSAPLPLVPGTNEVDIDIANGEQSAQSYRVAVHRAHELAQYAYGKASNTGAGDRFGVALDLSGDTLVIGAPLEDSSATGSNGDQADNSAPDSGAVYIFRHNGSSWAQEAYLKAPSVHAGDRFGNAVALSGDTLVVAAPFEDGNAAGVNSTPSDHTLTQSGAVYVFRRTGASWALEAYLKASNPDLSDLFGSTVALAGNTLAVAALGESSNATGIDGDQGDNSARSSGAVYVFRRTGTSWAQETYLKGSNTETFDHFGSSLALSADLTGDTLAIGAVNEGSSATGVGGDQNNNDALGSGAVYVFRHGNAGWAQEAYLKASNTGIDDFFGTSLALSGNTLAVGAVFESSSATGVGGDQNNDDALDSGAVYIFRRIDASWTQEAYLKASNTDISDRFGSIVALSGNRLAVSAPGESSSAAGINGNQSDDSLRNSGAVYMFRRTQGSEWVQETYVKASNPELSDGFGAALALSGTNLVVTAPSEDSAATGLDGNQSDNSASASGAVYLFH